MTESESYIFKSEDWDHNVTDVHIVLFGSICWVKGFDDDEWEECNQFIYKLSELTGLPEYDPPEEYQF